MTILVTESVFLEERSVRLVPQNQNFSNGNCLGSPFLSRQSSSMAPKTRKTSFPAVVIERETDTEESSEEEQEEDDVEEVSEEEEEEEESETDNGKTIEETAEADKKKGKAPITISLKKVCKVNSVPTKSH